MSPFTQTSLQFSARNENNCDTKMLNDNLVLITLWQKMLRLTEPLLRQRQFCIKMSKAASFKAV